VIVKQKKGKRSANHYSPGTGDHVPVIVGGVLGRGADGIIDVFRVPDAQLPFEVTTPQVRMPVAIDGPAVERASGRLGEDELFIVQVHVFRGSGQVALGVIGRVRRQTVGRLVYRVP